MHNLRSVARLRSSWNLPGLCLLVFLGLSWELLVDLNVISYEFLPSPSQVALAGERLISSGELGRNAAHTLVATLVGWIIAAVVGISVGILLGLSRVAWGFSVATIEVLRALPAIAFVPVAILVFGFSLEMELIVVVFVSQWPILINTIEGVRSVTPAHQDVARIMRLGRLEHIRKIVLPSAAPHVIVGLQLGLALALALAIVAEMLGNPAGIGYALSTQQLALQPENMFAYVVVTGLLGLVLNAGFLRLAALLFPALTALPEERV